MSETTFTVKEFHEQVLEFRKMFGDKRFWAKSSAQRNTAQEALSFAYLFLEKSTPQAEINRCASLLTQTLTEYSRREMMMIEHGMEVGD